MANKISSATKVVIPCRISFANIFEAKSINGGEAKFSVSCLIPKEDKKTLLAIHKAVEAAKEDGKTRKWGGKIPPNLKLPLRDGDIDRPDDARWKEAEEFITQHGTIVKTPSGYWQQVPQVSIAQTYLKIMNKFAEQFGLTPSSRSRIIASDGGPTDAADEMENLLGGGGS